jgi:hypothetical protein
MVMESEAGRSIDQQIDEALADIEEALQRLTIDDRRAIRADAWSGTERRHAVLDRRFDGALRQIEAAHRRLVGVAGTVRYSGDRRRAT